MFNTIVSSLQLPKGGDDNWLIKMHESLGDKDHYEKPRLSRSAFIIKHYADNVAYEVAGFMEKNKVGDRLWRSRPAKSRC